MPPRMPVTVRVSCSPPLRWPPALLATARSTVLTSYGVRCGCLLSSRATSPVTCGAAKEFPVETIVAPDSHGTLMSMPGAPKSVGGAGLASRPNGSCPSCAATEMTEENWLGRSAPGHCWWRRPVRRRRTPLRRQSRGRVRSNSSRPVLRDRLITRAPWLIAQRRPAAKTTPLPVSRLPRTRTDQSVGVRGSAPDDPGARGAVPEQVLVRALGPASPPGPPSPTAGRRPAPRCRPQGGPRRCRYPPRPRRSRPRKRRPRPSPCRWADRSAAPGADVRGEGLAPCGS